MSLPYFPLYPKDFEAKTSHLTMLEDGAYNRLMRLCWMTPGCSLPADEEWIMRRARAHSEEEKTAVRTVLGEFFTTEKGRVFQPRLIAEALLAENAHSRRVEAGRKGGRKSKSPETNEKTLSNAKAKPKQPEPEPYIEDTDVSSPKKPTKRKSRIVEDAAITDGMCRAAEKRGHSLQEAEAQFQRFKNDALAKGKTFLDWDRAFVTWLDSPYFKPITQREGKPNDGEAAERARRAGERYAERQRTRGLDFGEGGDTVVPLLPAGQSFRGS